MTTRLRLLALAALLAVPAVARADDPLPAELNLIPRDADAVVSVRVARLWKSDLFQSWRAMDDGKGSLLGYRPGDLDRVTAAATAGDGIYVLTTIAPTDRKLVLKEIAPRAREVPLGAVKAYRDEDQWVTVAFVGDRTAVVGSSDVVELHFRRGFPKAGPHVATLALAAKHDLVVAAIGGPSGLPALAKKLPAGIVPRPLFDASHAVVVGDYRPAENAVTVPTLRLTATVRHRDAKAVADAAQTGWSAAKRELAALNAAWAKEGPGVREELRGGVVAAARTLEAATAVKVESANAARGEVTIGATVRNPTDVGTLALTAAFDTAAVNIYSDGSLPAPDPNLGKVAAAMLAYAKDHGRLPPPAVYAKDGKTPLLSWRVLLLPYLGEAAKALHAAFKLDEPWDGDHNLRLVRRMPKLFAPADYLAVSGATTAFQVFTGPDTLFPGPTGRRLADIPDGAATTFLVAQAARRVPWTKPEDLAYRAAAPVPLLGQSDYPGRVLHGPAAHVVFADGTVRVFPTPHRTDDTEGWADSFNEGAVRARITPAGGERVDADAPFQRGRVLNPPLLELPGASPTPRP